MSASKERVLGCQASFAVWNLWIQDWDWEYRDYFGMNEVLRELWSPWSAVASEYVLLYGGACVLFLRDASAVGGPLLDQLRVLGRSPEEDEGSPRTKRKNVLRDRYRLIDHITRWWGSGSGLLLWAMTKVIILPCAKCPKMFLLIHQAFRGWHVLLVHITAHIT